MAYISTEKVAEMRRKIRDKFPKSDGWRFSVKGDSDHSTIYVAIMKGPIVLEAYENAPGELLVMPTDRVVPLTYGSVNHYFIGKCHPPATAAVLHELNQIVHQGHWDRSDVMSDYFNCSWYIDLRVGRDGRHYEVV